ncbi:MAG TPA: winged helix-turn-helix domain-containing protein [Vicinamibacterales bacterium]|nr:winged helix-turn-helix domain-containing protein [Vicinamibacterales bacterium]
MMIPERPTLERRVLAALDGSAGGSPRIPVLLGGCGSGRTSLLLRLRDLIGRSQAQYVDVERIATTPERFLQALRESSPFASSAGSAPQAGAREAFDASLAFLDAARAPAAAPATFLIDEFLELRTFESFPGLRTVLRDLIGALAAGGNRFVLTSRYAGRAMRLLRDAPSQFEIIPVAPLTAAEVRATLPGAHDDDHVRGLSDRDGTEDEVERRRDELARVVHALADGRPSYVRAIAETATETAPRGDADPISALAALLAPGGQLAQTCRFCYELRLHRARGYGALKAILEVLAQQEPLTLTEIAQRLHRTPGSTKDYLSWLEDVDLIASHQKRYSFADPMLRLWVRLHCRAVPPADEDIAREVHAYVQARLPHAEPALALSAAVEREKNWGIIEID